MTESSSGFQKTVTASNSLNQALSNLRTLLHDHTAAPPFLLVTPHTLQFNSRSDFHLDVQDLEVHLTIHPSVSQPALATPSLRDGSQSPGHPATPSPGHLATPSPGHLATPSPGHPAIHGPFLEGLAFDGCPDFEEWVVMVRERLHRLYVDALRHEADACACRGDYDQALQFAWRQIELDPWLEEAHVQVMRWLAATGRRSEALVQYHLCRRMLAQELGIDPASGTTQLYQQIRDGAAISPGP